MSISINGEALAKFIEDEITDNRRCGASESSIIIADHRGFLIKVSVIERDDYCYSEGLDEFDEVDLYDGIAINI